MRSRTTLIYPTLLKDGMSFLVVHSNQADEVSGVKFFWHAFPATLCSTIFHILLQPAVGQFLPANAADFNLTTIYSPTNDNITISFKTPPIGTCTTVFSTQKQFTGYVSIPPFRKLSAGWPKGTPVGGYLKSPVKRFREPLVRVSYEKPT